MHYIQTAAGLTGLCRTTPDSELASVLERYAAILDEFGDDLHAAILVMHAGDDLAEAEHACARRLVAEGHFADPVELLTQHPHWAEAVWIDDDDGAGLVLLAEIAAGTNSELLSAITAALAEAKG